MQRWIGLGLALVSVTVLAGTAAGCGSSLGTRAPSGPTTSTTIESAYAVLPPATSRPAYKECDVLTTTDADGTVTPLQCADGAINADAWRHYANTARTILGLGASATKDTVVSALCSAKATATTPILVDAYRLAYLYYGWHLSSNLAEDTLVTDPNACS